MFDWMNDVLQFLVDLLLWIPRKIWELLLDGIAAVVALIPMPEWVTQMASAAGAIPPSVTWWLDLFQVNTGLVIVGSAYLIRFTIRRTPVVG